MSLVTVSRIALSPAQLGRLVAAAAADQGTWRDLVRFDYLRRWYHRLACTDSYELWLLTWLPGQRTGLHDHGASAGAFAVAAGALAERKGLAGATHLDRSTYPAGAVRAFGPAHVHDVGNDSARRAISIHAYSPPLAAMRRFEMTAAGLVHTGTDSAGAQW